MTGYSSLLVGSGDPSQSHDPRLWAECQLTLSCGTLWDWDCLSPGCDLNTPSHRQQGLLVGHTGE